MRETANTDYQQFFSSMEDFRIEGPFHKNGQSFTVEELYQAFKARLMDELAVVSPELLNPAQLAERATEPAESDAPEESYASNDDWWLDMLAQYRNDGRADADKGVFQLPYPGTEDPYNKYINDAYKDGFDERRRELGDKFSWAEDRTDT